MARSAPAGQVLRFSHVERAVHWSTGALILALIATAIVLYVPSVSERVGRRASVRDIHVWSGVLLPLPVLLGLSSARLRRDLRRLARWDPLDLRWVRSLGRDPSAPPGKFNAGQKLFAAFIGAAGVSMLVTGAIMKWHDPFPLAWRTGSTLVHDVLAFLIVVAVGGHIVKALAEPTALRSMFRGWVPAAWAQHARPRWHAELDRAGLLPTPEEARAGALPAGSHATRWLGGKLPVGRVRAFSAATLVLGVAVLAASGGGAGGRSESAGSVALRWEMAVARGDYDALYDLAARDLQGSEGRSAFLTGLALFFLYSTTSKENVVSVTVESAEERGDEATVDVQLSQRNGVDLEQIVHLRREGGDWKVAEYPLSPQ